MSPTAWGSGKRFPAETTSTPFGSTFPTRKTASAAFPSSVAIGRCAAACAPTERSSKPIAKSPSTRSSSTRKPSACSPRPTCGARPRSCRSTRGPRKPEPLRVLFVGGDFVRKGGDLLLEVAKTRLKGKVELYLVTAADVPAEDNIFVYRGVKPHSPALLQRYAKADVFVLPTR